MCVDKTQDNVKDFFIFIYNYCYESRKSKEPFCNDQNVQIKYILPAGNEYNSEEFGNFIREVNSIGNVRGILIRNIKTNRRCFTFDLYLTPIISVAAIILAVNICRDVQQEGRVTLPLDSLRASLNLPYTAVQDVADQIELYLEDLGINYTIRIYRKLTEFIFTKLHNIHNEEKKMAMHNTPITKVYTESLIEQTVAVAMPKNWRDLLLQVEAVVRMGTEHDVTAFLDKEKTHPTPNRTLHLQALTNLSKVLESADVQVYDKQETKRELPNDPT